MMLREQHFREHAIQKAEEHDEELEEREHEVLAQRRRWLLWFPMLLIGCAMLVWQVTSLHPLWILVLLGIALCVPWVADA